MGGGSRRRFTTIFTSSIFLPGDLQGVDQPGAGDDCRTMLVIVHDGDIQLILQASLDLETLRCLDILQVDSSERSEIAFTVWINFSGSFSFTSISNTSMPANILNSNPLPSITGLPAKGLYRPARVRRYR